MRVVLKITMAIVSRLLFLVHSLLTISYTVELKRSNAYWFLSTTNILLLVESIYSVVKKRGEENRWICLSALFYLLSTVPAIWFLELDKLDKMNGNSTTPDLSTNNATENVTVASVSSIGDTLRISQLLSSEIDISGRLIEVIEQTLLLMMIITRWLMPRGAITRDELSQVLFVYIAVASDIMELFQLFEEKAVLNTPNMNIIILAVWSVSLLQFILVLTASQSLRRARVMGVVGDPSKAVDDGTQPKAKTRRHPCITFFRTPEVWSLIASLFLMDGPFLCIRVYCLVQLDLFTYNIIFFVVKNFLMVLLLLYRLVIVSFQICVPGFDEKWFGEDNMAADYSPEKHVKGPTREENGHNAIELRHRPQEAPHYVGDEPQKQQRSMKRQYFNDGPEHMYRVYRGGGLRGSGEIRGSGGLRGSGELRLSKGRRGNNREGVANL